MKKIKPVDFDIHLKYICHECGATHWLSLIECQTKNFKVVCHCRYVFKPKRIENVKIQYVKTKIKNKPNNDESVVDKAVKVLIAYGFSRDEASKAVTNSFSANPVCDHIVLVKQTLASMRE